MPGPGNPNFMAGVPELLILRLLQDREMYGYEIAAAIRAQTGGVVAASEGVIYPVLHALARDGALKAQTRPAAPGAVGRARVYYSLTSRGVRRLFELTDRWAAIQDGVQRVLNGPRVAGGRPE